MINHIISVLSIGCVLFFSSVLNGQNTSDTLQSLKNQAAKFRFDGEIRGRIRNFNNINFGDVAISENDYDTEINLRGIINGDLHLNKTFRLYTQLISGYTFYKDNISPKDNDLLAIGQLFIDVHFKAIPLGFKLGRQDLSFGSGRILGASTGPNISENFNGFALYANPGKITGSIFYVLPDNLKEGVFDNTIDKDNMIYGSYLTINLNKDQVLDLYSFGNYRKNMTIDSRDASESRYTLGGRFSKSQGSLTYEIEVTRQFGNFNSKRISAFYSSSSISYNWQNARLNQSVQIAGTVYSGDKDSTDQEINMFRPIRARPPISRIAPIGPSNILMLVPQYGITISNIFEISFRYYMVWRYTRYDGLYSINLESRTRETDIEAEKNDLFVAHGCIAQFSYILNNHVEISLAPGWFFAGDYLCNTGKGKNPIATYLVAYYRF